MNRAPILTRFAHACKLTQQKPDFDCIARFGFGIHRFGSDTTGFGRVGFGFEGESYVVKTLVVNVHGLNAKQHGTLRFHNWKMKQEEQAQTSRT